MIVALGMGAVLATTYVTTKSTTSGVAANAARSVRAAWSGRGAADVARAIFETDIDWRTAIADGVLIDNQSVFGATISVECTDLTGAIPTPDTRMLVVTVRSRVDGVEEVEQKIFRVIADGALEDAVDFSFDEFTVWADARFGVDATSVVGIWPKSPEATGLAPVKIGLGFVGTPGFAVDPAAQISRAAFYTPVDAMAALHGVIDSIPGCAGHETLPVHLSAYPASAPMALSALPPAAAGPVTISAITQTLAPGYYPSLTIDNGAEVLLDGAAGDYAFGDLTVQDGSVLLIKDTVRVRIENGWVMKSLSAVEYATGSSMLRVFADGAIVFDNCAVGFDRSVARDPIRDPFAVDYFKPKRLYINMIDNPMLMAQSLTVDNGALFVGAVHAPKAVVTVRNGSTLFGRATGWRVSVQANSMILGDPSLDPGVAFTRTDGVLYDDPTLLADALAAVTPGADAATAEAQVVAFIQMGLLGASPSPIPMGSPVPLGTPPTPRFPGRVFGRDWPERVMVFEARSRNTGGGGGGGGGGGSNDGLIQNVMVEGATGAPAIQ
ncbi:MAG: hypothetical protein D6693_03800 [Planctomycetota bacterium]|nr:MAG: hypothetical protein D6693_03800 [Planctomycetota bacterium]